MSDLTDTPGGYYDNTDIKLFTMLHANETKLIKRLRIIKGQVGALEKMVEDKEYCPDILRLSLAVQKSLQSFNQVMLENHIAEHISLQFKKGNDKKAIAELLEIYSLSNK